SSCSSLFVFFVAACFHHQVLYSFPTRRSSDLMLFFTTSGYADVAEGGLTGGIEDSASRNQMAELAFNLVSIPQLWTGVFGSWGLDRKSTRLNSSHVKISYAVFCLKKKNKET